MYGKKKYIALSTVSMAFVVSAALCGNALIANADEYYTPQLRPRSTKSDGRQTEYC